MALRFVTWNVHGCHAHLTRFDAETIAAVLAELEPDVVALQEAASLVGRIDPVETIARLLGLHAVFGPNLVRDGGHRYGNALLSRFPVHASTNHDLTVRGREPRGALVADVDADGIALRVCSVHFGLSARERHAQASRLASLLDESRPSIVGGDMNDWRSGADTRAMRARFDDATSTGATYPARLPLLRLDHVYVAPGIEVEHCAPVRTALARRASDHLPLAARLVLPAADALPSRARASHRL